MKLCNRNDPRLSKKKKMHTEGRQFSERWESEYLLVLQGGKPGCLLCSKAVSVLKEYNLHWNFETTHEAKNANVSHQEQQGLVQEIKGRLKSQKNMFNNATAQNDAELRRSFIVTDKIITRASECFSNGAFLKCCMLNACEQVCPNQIQTFTNVSLSRITCRLS